VGFKILYFQMIIQVWDLLFFSFALPSRPKSLRLQKKSPSGDPLPKEAKTSDVAKSAVDAAIFRKPPGKVIGATSFILNTFSTELGASTKQPLTSAVLMEY
jgi:hypothetical protein